MDPQLERGGQKWKQARPIARIVGAAVAGLIALTVLLGSFYTVDAGTMAVHTRFGSVVGVSGPGLHFKLPWFDDVTHISVRTETVDWSRAPDGKDGTDKRMEAYSHDQQPAMMSVKVAYHVKADELSIKQLYSQFRNTNGVANAVLIPRAAQAVKTTFGQFTAVSVVQNRAKFNEIAAKAVQDLVDSGVDGKPVPLIIDGVQIYDIKFSQAYEHAVEERMKAEVEVAKVSQNLERERKTAEIAVVQAKGEADSNLAKAEASAKATRLRGDAEAFAIKVKSDALRDSPKLIELTIAEKWNGALPTTMVPGSAVPMLPIHSAK
jgi:regulator of protease activity HflC (stomatin/prohibitin superfamily)